MPIGASLAPYAPLVEGVEIGGEIVDFRIQQKSDYDTNRPLYFAPKADGGGKTFEAFSGDGKANEPICDWVFTVDTGQEDENGETERRIFLDPRVGARGTAVEGKRGKDAVINALKKVKAHRVGLEIGGKIFITRGPKVAPKKGSAQCVTYTARYEPPAGGPGSGTPVDEDMHLVGGAIFNPLVRDQQTPVTSFGGSGVTASGLGQNGGAVVVYDPPVQERAVDDDPPF